jgi:hypothetical protein
MMNWEDVEMAPACFEELVWSREKLLATLTVSFRADV